MINVNSIIKMDWGCIQALTEAQVTALEQTAEYLHTEVVQAQVVPRMDGALQGDSFFPDYSECSSGKAVLVHSTPYARRMYYHPEYHFHKEKWKDKRGEHDGNANARGEWYEDWLPGGNKDQDCQKTYKQIYKRITGV